MTLDEDGQQEYALAILEGHTEREAIARARSAVDKVNSRRLSGPITGDTRGGHGDRPLVSDMWEYQDHGVSITQDARTDEERESDWARADFARECLELVPPKTRLVVTDYLGFETGTPMSGREIAARHNVHYNSVAKYVQRAGASIRRQLAVTDVTHKEVANA